MEEQKIFFLSSDNGAKLMRNAIRYALEQWKKENLVNDKVIWEEKDLYRIQLTPHLTDNRDWYEMARGEGKWTKEMLEYALKKALGEEYNPNVEYDVTLAPDQPFYEVSLECGFEYRCIWDNLAPFQKTNLKRFAKKWKLQYGFLEN